MNEHLLKQFKLSESEVKQILASLSPGQTLLDALFEKNLVDPIAYIQWAKDHYSLPVLKIEFLNKNNNVEALLDRYKSVFPKNIIPFHEMDGVLYVMCLEPTPFEAPQTVQYVLAPYDVISKYASKTVAKQTPHQEIESVLVKENTNPLFKNLGAKSDTLEGFDFDKISTDTSGTPEAPVQPEGIDLKISNGPTAEGEIPEISLEEKKDVPAGLDFPPNPSIDEMGSYVTDQPVTAVDLQSFKFEGLVPVKEGYKAPVDTSTPKLTTVTADSLVAKHPPKKAPATTAPAKPDIPPPQPQTPQQQAAAPTMPPPIAMPQVPTTKTSVGAGAQQFDGILNTMKKYFEQSMVLMFKGDVLEPQAWDSTWVKAAHTQSAIDVTTPSIFRIVHETHHPYHGHVVPNPINESFFNNWNKGIYPQHVTICPIIHEKKMYGMILGATTKESAKKYQLHHIQEIANDTFALLSSKKAA